MSELTPGNKLLSSSVKKKLASARIGSLYARVVSPAVAGEGGKREGYILLVSVPWKLAITVASVGS